MDPLLWTSEVYTMICERAFFDRREYMKAVELVGGKGVGGSVLSCEGREPLRVGEMVKFLLEESDGLTGRIGTVVEKHLSYLLKKKKFAESTYSFG
jgi:hypothetical protein